MSQINISQEKIKPTLDKRDRTEHGENLDKNFTKTMRRNDIDLTEVDQMLNEKTKSLKKQIWDLAKMEALVHGDQKLAAIYNEMSEDGEEKYGYHYNETIMNIIFNEYVLNSVKYLAKYKSAVPVEKKRRDKTGINKLQQTGEDKQDDDDKDVDEVVTHNNSLEGVQSDDINDGRERNGYGDENDRGYLNHRIEKKYDVDVDETTGAASSGAFSAKAGFDPMNDNDEIMYESMENKKTLNEKAESEAQQKLMGMAYAYKKGEMDDATDKVKELADSMSMDDLKDFASTKHDNIPAKKKTDEGEEELDETTTSSSSGAYETPYAFANGKSRHANNPAWDGGEMVSETYLTNPDTFRLIYESLQEDDDNPCWDGYKQVGMKTKDGEEVPNCVPLDEDNHTDSLVPNALEEHHLESHQEKSEFLSQQTGIDMQVYLAMDEDLVDQLYRSVENDLGMQENKIDGSKFLGKQIDPPFHKMKESIIDDQPDSIAATMADVQPSSFMEENKKCRDGEIPNPNREDEDDPNCVKKDTYYKNKKDGDNKSSSKKKQKPKEDRFNLETRKEREQEYQNKLKKKKMGYDKELKENQELMESLKKLSNGEVLSEDKQHPSMVNLERLKKDNQKNFKGDMKDSNSTDIAAGQGKAERADDQYTDIDDPQELSKEIEDDKLSQNDGESFDNEGDSTNDTNDEIPKRNRTKEEQESVALNRGYGMEALDYDLEPSERFKERAKKDMGEEYYEIGQEKVKQRNDQVMYNKDEQPVQDESKYKKSSVSEGTLTGKYRDNKNTVQFVNFKMSQVEEVKKIDESYEKVSLDGLGNVYTNDIHENADMRNAMNSFEVYVNSLNGKLVRLRKDTGRQMMVEGENKKQESINEGLEKMKKLWGYKPDNYLNTKNVKKNRGF